ncbi:ubiquitin-conjugating enzyme/RWD-like protein [Aspergillus pseudotamarii]|uniref:Signal peptidase complex catalytic subunit SEC11 n=1 Tax=Aspergillus pseudotamarii TaxID=132259 RepID=A0A5N6SXF8_ASPPS|nr:ubiquitin-conjugating enzyme/RWD-like protein [Aspergillus pseudotamarii]KAE8138430.1 ubiquitin-conjugating enzyme/RWD-like protein [Aspergillus pseudotamarii]
MLSFLSSNLSNARQSLAQVLNFALVLSTAFMMWKGLSVFTASSSPVVVVLSGSMEPAFQRGDLLFLWNRSPRAELGEIVVYNVRGKDIPIVHRVVRTFPEIEGKTKKVKEISESSPIPNNMLLTKGDNNIADDVELYARGQDYLNREEDIVGSVRGYIPMVGYVTILLSDKRIAKELAELTESPPEGITVELANESDIYQWKVYMDGPEGSPYHNGKFLVKLSLPTEYPFKPPSVSFGTKIYHPNVTNDDKGSMCLGMLRADEWKPSSKIAAVLEFARQLLVEPMPDDAVEGRIAEQYKNDRARYDEIAREWTRKYAMA